VLLESRTGVNRHVEARTEWGNTTPPTWAQLQGVMAPGSMRLVTPQQYVTVPTIIGGLQLIAGAAAALPWLVYEDLGEYKQARYDSWQYVLLETYPGPYTDPFQVRYDVFYSLEYCGNAFVLKVKNNRGEVEELIVLDPDTVAIRNENGEKKFDIKVGNNTVYKGATVSEILHIKNLPKSGAIFSGTCGLKLIAARLGNEITATEWEGRFFVNDATPPLVVTLGEEAGADEMKEAYDSWQRIHSGPFNAGKVAILGGGAKVEKIGFNMHEAQLIESHEFNVLEFCRAMNLPTTMFIPPHTKPQGAEDEALVFNTFYLGPRLRRVESAFNSDPDFFAFNSLWCKLDERAMLRANVTSMSGAYHNYLQTGVFTPDEVRAELGYGPLPPMPSEEEALQNPGKIPQITPVGGAPNPDINAGAKIKSAETSKE